MALEATGPRRDVADPRKIHAMKLLLTGFEPFGGSHINPSEQVVPTLVRDGMTGVAWHMAILPVDRQGGPATLLNAVRAFNPDAIVCLGEVTRRLGGCPRMNVCDLLSGEPCGGGVQRAP